MLNGSRSVTGRSTWKVHVLHMGRSVTFEILRSRMTKNSVCSSKFRWPVHASCCVSSKTEKPWDEDRTISKICKTTITYSVNSLQMVWLSNMSISCKAPKLRAWLGRPAKTSRVYQAKHLLHLHIWPLLLKATEGKQSALGLLLDRLCSVFPQLHSYA